jgi:hypothetical protein
MVSLASANVELMLFGGQQRKISKSHVLLSRMPFSDCSKSCHVWGRARILAYGEPGEGPGARYLAHLRDVESW